MALLPHCWNQFCYCYVTTNNALLPFADSFTHLSIGCEQVFLKYYDLSWCKLATPLQCQNDASGLHDNPFGNLWLNDLLLKGWLWTSGIVGKVSGLTRVQITLWLSETTLPHYLACFLEGWILLKWFSKSFSFIFHTRKTCSWNILNLAVTSCFLPLWSCTLITRKQIFSLCRFACPLPVLKRSYNFLEPKN